MAEHTTLSGLFSDLADAIRAKTGGSGLLAADSFPTAVGTIQNVTQATGTFIPAGDTGSVTIQTGLSAVKELCVFADVEDPYPFNAGEIIKASSVKASVSDYASEHFSSSILEMINGAVGSCVYRASTTTGLGITSLTTEYSGGTVVLNTSSASRVFKQGQTYRWVACGWEEQ